MTLTDLVQKAREFDHVYQLYNSPAFTQHQPGIRTRGSTTEDALQINYSGTPQTPSQQRGPLSKEERERRFKEKLCLYCGKPNHIAKNCRQKQNPQKKPGAAPPKVRMATITETPTEEAPTEGLQISSFRVSSPVPYDLGIIRPKSAPQDF
jgi:hypothetical protein